MFTVQEYNGALYRIDSDTGNTWKMGAYSDEWEPVDTTPPRSPDTHLKIGCVIMLRSPEQPAACASCGINSHDLVTFPATITTELIQFAYNDHIRRQKDEATT